MDNDVNRQRRWAAVKKGGVSEEDPSQLDERVVKVLKVLTQSIFCCRQSMSFREQP